MPRDRALPGRALPNPLPGELPPGDPLTAFLPPLGDEFVPPARLIRRAYVRVELANGLSSILLATAVYDGPRLADPLSLEYTPVVPLGRHP